VTIKRDHIATAANRLAAFAGNALFNSQVLRQTSLETN
jgi:hypothetical protein